MGLKCLHADVKNRFCKICKMVLRANRISNFISKFDRHRSHHRVNVCARSAASKEIYGPFILLKFILHLCRYPFGNMFVEL